MLICLYLRSSKLYCMIIPRRLSKFWTALSLLSFSLIVSRRFYSSSADKWETLLRLRASDSSTALFASLRSISSFLSYARLSFDRRVEPYYVSLLCTALLPLSLSCSSRCDADVLRLKLGPATAGASSSSSELNLQSPVSIEAIRFFIDCRFFRESF